MKFFFSLVLVVLTVGAAFAKDECWDTEKFKEYLPALKECGMEKEVVRDHPKMKEVFTCIAKKEKILDDDDDIIVKELKAWEEKFALPERTVDIDAIITKCSDDKEKVEMDDFFKCYHEELVKLCHKDMNFFD